MNSFEASWRGDLDKIKQLTLTTWDDAKIQAPLAIAAADSKGNNPFSLAFLRGHYDVAKAILDIAQAQYVPEETVTARFRMGMDVDDSEYDESDNESIGDEPRLYREIIDTQFTIENIGEVSMQVKSRVKPQDLLGWSCPSFQSRGGKVGSNNLDRTSLLHVVIEQNDHHGLKFLLDLGTYYSTMKLDPEDEPNRFYPFPNHVFQYAVSKGRTEMLAEIIKRTGAGLPLEDLVKRSGVDLKEKPRYYQGLTVYGKKR